MALVDYGSGSGSDSEDDNGSHLGSSSQKKKIPSEANIDDDSYFNDDVTVSCPDTLLNLPDATQVKRAYQDEQELDELVKPKDWEIKLAEKSRRKLQKKSERKLKKEKKREKRDKEEKAADQQGRLDSRSFLSEKDPAKKAPVKAKIAAFGALAAIADDSDSEDDIKPDKSAPATSSFRTGLLAMLPAPKTTGSRTIGLPGQAKGNNTSLVPSTLRNKTKPLASSVAQPVKRKADSDGSDDDDDVTTDFFGLSSAPEVKLARLDHVPIVASSGLVNAAGPSKPAPDEYVHPSQMYNYADTGIADMGSASGDISNEQAVRLLSRDESIQMMERRSLHDIAANMIDVRVDEALGPNVHANLLKNLTQKAMAKDAMAPLPKSKNVTDQNAKRKHQITYLATLAVAREEALQEQWAEGRHLKKMGREKYGF